MFSDTLTFMCLTGFCGLVTGSVDADIEVLSTGNPGLSKRELAE